LTRVRIGLIALHSPIGLSLATTEKGAWKNNVIRIQTDLYFLSLAGRTCSAEPLGGMIEGGAKTHDGNVAKLRFLVRQNRIKEEERCDKGHFLSRNSAYCTAAALHQL
jgi:hypothetical protein